MHIFDISESSRSKPIEPQCIMPGDKLDITKINKLPHPIMARLFGGSEYEIETLDVQTGCMRIMVGCMVDPMHISDASMIIDIDGNEHDPDDLWIE